MLTEKEIQKNRKVFSEIDKTMVVTFKALSDVNRYRIFRILAEEPKLSISTIAQILNISLPLTSQHIKILVQAKLLEKERSGKRIFSKLEDENPVTQVVAKTIKQVGSLSKKLK